MKRVLMFISGVGLAVYGVLTFWSRNKQRVDSLDEPARKFTKRAKRIVKRFGSDTHDAVDDVRSSAVKTQKDLAGARDDAVKDAKRRLARDSQS